MTINACAICFQSPCLRSRTEFKYEHANIGFKTHTHKHAHAFAQVNMLAYAQTRTLFIYTYAIVCKVYILNCMRHMHRVRQHTRSRRRSFSQTNKNVVCCVSGEYNSNVAGDTRTRHACCCDKREQQTTTAAKRNNRPTKRVCCV